MNFLADSFSDLDGNAGMAGSAQFTLNKTGGGTVEVDYLDISYSNATPADTWFATNSINSGNNTGWDFGEIAASGFFFAGNF